MVLKVVSGQGVMSVGWFDGVWVVLGVSASALYSVGLVTALYTGRESGIV